MESTRFSLCSRFNKLLLGNTLHEFLVDKKIKTMRNAQIHVQRHEQVSFDVNTVDCQVTQQSTFIAK